VAESSYGAIIGFAEIDIASLAVGDCIKHQLRTLVFKARMSEAVELTENAGVFLARTQITIASNPIAPEL
jgi:lipid-binding SYLF domain-containing protein